MVHKSTAGRTAAGIAASLESRIHAGRLAAGEALPPVRELAKSLRVSPATVATAYGLLRLRGWATGDRRRGTRVRGRVEMGRSELARSTDPGADKVDLFSGNPDPELLPSLGAALKAVPIDPGVFGQRPDVPGLITFAKGEFAADGIDAPNVVVTAGGLDAIERVLREHLRPGDRVAVEDPVFPTLLDLLAASGFIAEPIAMDAEGPTPAALNAALKRRAAAMIVTPRAQNPTGACISAARAGDLRTVLKRYPAVLLVENDPLGPVAGAPVVTLTGVRSRWAIVRSTTKFLGPDLRVALLAGDELTVARVRARQAVGTRWVSHFLQQLALALWSDPSSGRLLARAAEAYARRRAGLLKELSAVGITVRAGSGFNVWIPVRHEADVVELLAHAGWAVAAGERFRLETGPGIRVTTSALAPDDAPRFASDLALALRTAAPMLA